MANFYYVKSGGSATGDAGRVATTRSTGSFATKGASAYYDNIAAALAATTAPADGDYILCSSAHNYTSTSTVTLNFGGAALTLMSVDDSNCDQYLAGAAETADNSTLVLDYRILPAASKRSSVLGFTFQCEDQFDIGTTSFIGAIITFKKCTFDYQAASTAADMKCYGSGSSIIFDECTFNPTHANWTISSNSGPEIVMRNCDGTASAACNFLFTAAGTGSTSVHATDCDFSGILKTAGTVFNLASTSYSGCFSNFNHCLFPTSWTAVSSPALKNFDIEFTGCGTADEYYSYLRYYYNEGTFAQEDTATYLDATYDGSTGFSIKITTDSGTLPTFPIKQKLITIPKQDLTSGKNYEIEFTSADSGLTDADVWLEARYIDNTSEALGVVVSTQNTDYFTAEGAGTAHTATGTGTWAGGTGSLGTDYRETVTIGSLAAVDNATVEVWACVGQASLVVAFDPAPNIS